jgi:plasmid stabilization system protein ParE
MPKSRKPKKRVEGSGKWPDKSSPTRRKQRGVSYRKETLLEYEQRMRINRNEFAKRSLQWNAHLNSPEFAAEQKRLINRLLTDPPSRGTQRGRISYGREVLSPRRAEVLRLLRERQSRIVSRSRSGGAAFNPKLLGRTSPTDFIRGGRGPSGIPRKKL